MPNLSLTVPYQSPGYGAAELKAYSQRYMFYGLLLATLVITSAVGSYYLVEWLNQEDEPIHTVRIMKYTDLGPPPSIQSNEVAPAVSAAGPAIKPSIGVPVPVPDAEVSPEQTIATQTELSATSAPASAEAGNGAGSGAVQVEQNLKIEDDGPPPDFVPYEKEPTIVKQVTPRYPELAQRAGLEGTVIVKMWVDKEGKVRKALVVKSDAKIFEEAAIEAAQQWVFTPAVMQKGPVSVWVSVPMRFKLNGSH